MLINTENLPDYKKLFNLKLVFAILISVIIILVLFVTLTVKNTSKIKSPANETLLPFETNRVYIKNWEVFNNNYGYQIMHPSQYHFLSSEPKISTDSASHVYLNNTGRPEIDNINLHIIVTDNKATFQNQALKDIIEYDYQLNSSESAKIKTLTKSLEISVFGVKGYEYYLEPGLYQGLLGKISFTSRSRVLFFEYKQKIFVILSDLSKTTENIISTLQIIQ